MLLIDKADRLSCLNFPQIPGADCSQDDVEFFARRERLTHLTTRRQALRPEEFSVFIGTLRVNFSRNFTLNAKLRPAIRTGAQHPMNKLVNAADPMVVPEIRNATKHIAAINGPASK
ncbi:MULTISPECIES: hypothetical protein [unclassified Ruegeria]|uniref:hypothetical protein n=1 Tax=unclassified Ruegeria TaxID=2625375 RepID=UPI001ADAC129|nr:MULTISPECIES: hypothetical protein [unclassified Ruegeria]MBO9412085.1 hypothetical protein [Ruegeria sp. R8_1]MBO9417194.1 hypothetical protein [Ruegeria sp. R8_2]